MRVEPELRQRIAHRNLYCIGWASIPQPSSCTCDDHPGLAPTDDFSHDRKGPPRPDAPIKYRHDP